MKPLRIFAHAAVPLVALALVFSLPGVPLEWWVAVLAAAFMVLTVILAVHHSEIIALRLGEPFGTLVLALAVTGIETSLIVSLMFSGGAAASALARDAVYATVMIICNGVVGACLLLGAARHRVLEFRVEGTTPVLSVLTALATFILVLPGFTITSPGPTYSASQLVFTGAASLTLYCIFVFVQTIRHRDYFLPVGHTQDASHAARPSLARTWLSVVLLLACLVAVVGLSKILSPGIEAGVRAANIPHAVVGVAVALMVLLPETWAAIRAAHGNRMQTSFNLALGSALATIGLTIPAVIGTSMVIGMPLTLGLPNKDIVLLAMTLLISAMTLSRGRATVLQGSVHTVLFFAFLFLTVVP
jgi:Ca2+:H+ antiporter